MDAQRRHFIKLGLGAMLGWGLVATGGLLTGCSSAPAPGWRWLRTQDVALLSALFPVVLQDNWTHQIPVVTLVRDVESFFLTTSEPGLAQIRKVLDLMTLAPSRWFLSRAPDWATISQPEATTSWQFLLAGRSSTTMAIAGFFTQVLTMAWFKRPESWLSIGYEPPQHIVSPV
ncbi:MAG: hypothetical protein HKM02_10140 [Pseudomonadales bacterium]|nr:hypothetical protein [Pseudomonadales bacterium]